MTIKEFPALQKPLTRREYLQIMHAGLSVGQYTFVRQASLSWLAAYPGDLQMSLLYARALFGENRLPSAVHVLNGLCKIDPEYTESIDALLEVLSTMKDTDYGNLLSSPRPGTGKDFISSIQGAAQAHWFALNGGTQNVEWSASWGGPLWLAKQAFKNGDLELARGLLDEMLESTPAHPLIGITYLQLIEKAKDFDRQAWISAARRYHHQWPDTLYFILRLAEYSLLDGKSDFAVALLHQAASRDIDGQVARRLWGEDHSFRPLWPEKLELTMNSDGSTRSPCQAGLEPSN